VKRPGPHWVRFAHGTLVRMFIPKDPTCRWLRFVAARRETDWLRFVAARRATGWCWVRSAHAPAGPDLARRPPALPLGSFGAQDTRANVHAEGPSLPLASFRRGATRGRSGSFRRRGRARFANRRPPRPPGAWRDRGFPRWGLSWIPTRGFRQTEGRVTCPAADRQRIVELFPTTDRAAFVASDRQFIVEIGVGPGSVSWNAGQFRHPLSLLPRRSALVSLRATKAGISRLFQRNQRSRPPTEGGLHVTGCCTMGPTEPRVLSQQVSALAVFQVNDGVADE
jgi:hypothetical protein